MQPRGRHPPPLPAAAAAAAAASSPTLVLTRTSTITITIALTLTLTTTFAATTSPDAVLDFKSHQAVPNAEVLNPAYDYIPPELLDLYITNNTTTTTGGHQVRARGT